MKISMGFHAAKEALGADSRETARQLRQAGFDGVDFDFSAYPLEEIGTPSCQMQILEQASSISEIGLEIVQCHLHYQPSHELLGDGSYEAFERAYLEPLLWEIALCARLHCPCAVLHLFFCPDEAATWQGNLRLLERLLPQLEKFDVTLALENIYGNGEAYDNCFVTTADQLLRYIRHFQSPLLKICLDTGHSVCTGQDTLSMARAFGEHLAALHVNSSSGRDTHLLPGALPQWVDPNDYCALSRLLAGLGYEGAYNLEIAPGRYLCQSRSAEQFLQLAAKTARWLAELADGAMREVLS